MSKTGEPHLPDGLVRFVQVLAEDDDLRGWFLSFEETPEAARSREFHQLAHRMQHAGEHPELVEATVLLAHPHIYRAARLALEELMGERW